MTAESWEDPYADVPPPEREPDDVIPISRGRRALMLPSPDQPMPVARELIQALWVDGCGRELIRHWRGDWVRYTGTHWETVSKGSIRAQVYLTLEHARYIPVDDEGRPKPPAPWNPTDTRVNKVLDALASAVHFDDDRDEDRGEYIALANGLLDLQTREMTAHDPDWFSFTCLPYAYDPMAGPPSALLAFAISIWGDDQESIDLLQEWLGYIVSGSLAYQKALLLIGPPRSGKGTILRLLTNLVGTRNRSALSMDALGRQFGLQGTIGKTLGVVGDARQDGRAPALLIERLLMIIAGDDIEFDRKNQLPWEGQLAMRLVIASNEMLRFRDRSGAIASRFLILHFTRSMLGQEDTTLESRLAAEMPEILCWALAGLDRLAARGRFSEPASSREERSLLEDLASPAAAFVRDYCEVDPAATEYKDVMFAAWKVWCEKNGHVAGSTTGLTQALGAIVRPLKADVRSKNPGAGRRRMYGGIRLQPDAAAELGISVGDGRTSETVAVGHWRDGTPVTVPRCLKCGDPIGEGGHGCPYDQPPLDLKS